MAHSRIKVITLGCHRWKHRCITRNDNMETQDTAQKIQIWCAYNTNLTDCNYYLPTLDIANFTTILKICFYTYLAKDTPCAVATFPQQDFPVETKNIVV